MLVMLNQLVGLSVLIAVAPTAMKIKIAATFKITNKFSTAAAPDVPRESRIATKTTTKIAKISTTPSLVKALAGSPVGLY